METIRRRMTWVEACVLFVVVVILGIVVVPNYQEAVSLSNDAIQKAHLQALGQALEEYKIDNGDYPPWVMYYPNETGGASNAGLPTHLLTTPVNYLPSLDVLTDVYTLSWTPNGRTYAWYRLQGTPGAECLNFQFGMFFNCSQSDFIYRTIPYLNCPAFRGMLTNKSSYVLQGAAPVGRVLGTGPCANNEFADMPYDPTNGVMSNGFIYYFGPESLSAHGWRMYQ